MKNLMTEKLTDISKNMLSVLRAEGADNARCIVNASETREFNVDNGVFSLYRTLYGSGVSLKALVGGREGTASGNSFEDDALKALCKECMASAKAGKPDDANTIASENRKLSFDRGGEDCDEDRLFERSRELLEDVKKRFPRITIEQMIVSHVRTETVQADLSGTVYSLISGRYMLSLMYSAHDGEKSSSFFDSSAVCKDLEKPFIKLGRIEQELKEVEKQIETKALSGKFEGSVILTPSVFADIIDSAMDFAFGSTLFEGTSPWKDSLLKKVADEKLTVSLAPLDERILTGSPVSGEGFLNRNFTPIEKGVLKSFVLSRYYAKKLSMQPSPNATGRYVVEGRDKSVADMVKGIKRGLWIGRLSGGAPASNGDFSAVAKNSFLIEDGEIKEAVAKP